MSGRNYGRAVLAAVIALAACDDSTSSTKPKQDAACEGFGGCGETGDTGVTGGTGGAGGETPPGEECLDDSNCDPSQFCAKTDGDLKGVCTEGCREGGCGEGQICGSDHVCGCTADTGCEAGSFCDTAEATCKPGCRPGDASSCPDGQTCNENHECEAPPAAAVCCGGAEGSTCTVTNDGTCEGTLLPQVDSCDPNPCGPTCTEDSECAADRYCSDQGICIPGCREAPNDNCPDGTYCDPAKNTCEPDAETPCQTSDDCEAGEFCEVETGLCLPGCDHGVAGECPPGEVCGDDNVCIPGCNQDVDCDGGQYCDPDLGCRDFCDGNDACQPDEFCDLSDPAGGRCVEGCRDDANDLPPGSNNDRDTATPIQLVDNHGEVQGQLVCPNNPDVYAVELFQQARMQVVLTAVDPNAVDINIRLWGPDAMAPVLLENLQPGSPKRLRFPEDAGMGVPAAGTYYIEVFSDDPASQAYNLSITLIDGSLGGGENACFPEDGEFDNGGRGHDNAADSVDLMWNGNRDETFTFSGSVCGSDEDWFTFDSPSQNAGASIELVVDGLVGEAVVELYDSLTVRNLGNPNYTTGAGVAGGGGTVTYRLDVPRDQAQLSEDTWYIRLRGRDAATVLDDYGLNIELLSPNGACNDGSEPNDGPNEATNLDVVPGISDRGRVERDADLEVPLELSLCARDEDWFAFTANDGDQVRAWATSANLAGGAEITIATPDGNALGTAGAVTQAGQNTNPASLNGTNPGVYYVRVRSLAAGTADPYTLFIHINPTAMCGADVAEVGPGGVRNDTSATATLMPSVDLQSLRYEYAAGLVCNLATPDQDWYRVNVAEDETRICIATEFQDVDGGDLSLQVFDCENDPAEDVPCNANGDCSSPLVRASRLCLAGDNVCGCRTDADCDVDNDGLDANDGRCVEARCKTPIASSTTDGAPELVDLARGIVGAGDLCILVSGVDRNNENAYELDVTLNVAGQLPCVPDWREQGQNNDGPDDSVYLGNRQAGVCDAWLCNDERGTGDWYSIDVPAGESRTVLVTYSENSDGRAVLLMQAKDVGNPELDVFYERPFDLPADSREECVNITAGGAGSQVFIGVQGDREQLADADEQIDYTLRVLPFDPATHPDGRCSEYVGNPTSVWGFDIP
jgi:hypothetical protein